MEGSFYLDFSEENQMESLMQMNVRLQQFGLALSEEDCKLLVRERKNSLREQQRIEFGEGVLEKLILAFADSDFVYQEIFVETMTRLQEIFYLYKNESMDELTDRELISYMREAFDGECQGSLEYLEDTCLEDFARKIRAKTHKFIGRYTKTNEEI